MRRAQLTDNQIAYEALSIRYHELFKQKADEQKKFFDESPNHTLMKKLIETMPIPFDTLKERYSDWYFKQFLKAPLIATEDCDELYAWVNEQLVMAVDNDVEAMFDHMIDFRRKFC